MHAEINPTRFNCYCDALHPLREVAIVADRRQGKFTAIKCQDVWAEKLD